ncbi:MAG: hypothetical protein JWQ54_4839 [Mucilaginibacter sp.]|nr:hypothetical protein [Mucilaginibacter sp.]
MFVHIACLTITPCIKAYSSFSFNADFICSQVFTRLSTFITFLTFYSFN